MAMEYISLVPYGRYTNIGFVFELYLDNGIRSVETCHQDSHPSKYRLRSSWLFRGCHNGKYLPNDTNYLKLGDLCILSHGGKV